MTPKSVIDTSALERKRNARKRPKGRAVDPQAQVEVRALLGDDPRRSDLLIEYLHRVQDRYGHISAAHIVALAAELKLAMTEVYEVATFYHHFDVIKEGDTPPPALTIRVCETLSCQMAGADALRAALERRFAPSVRVIGAPCIGRCEHAPAAVVGRNPVDRATRSPDRQHGRRAPHRAGSAALYRLCRVSRRRRLSDVLRLRRRNALG